MPTAEALAAQEWTFELEGPFVQPGATQVAGWGTLPWGIIPFGSRFNGLALDAAEPWIFQQGGPMRTLRKTVGDTVDVVIGLRHKNTAGVVVAVDLTDATEIRFQVQDRDTGDLRIDLALDPVTYAHDRTGGKFWVPIDDADVTEAFTAWAEVEVEFTSGEIMKIPNRGHNLFVVQEEVHDIVP